VGEGRGEGSNGRRRARYALRALALAAIVALFAYVVIRGTNRGNDFKYFYGAARLLWKGGHLRVDSQPRYPITLHVMLAPLASRSIGTAATVWAALSFGAVGSLPWALARLTGVRPRRQFLAWAAVAPFFIDALSLGQSDPINFALVAWGLVAVKEGRGFVGSLLIGMAGLIKILPAVHWATALTRSRSTAVFAGVAATIVAGFGLVALAVGPEEAIRGFHDQAEWISRNEKPWHLVARGGDLRPNNESLPIVLARTFGAMPEGFRPRNALVVARLPLGLIWGAWGTVLVGLALTWLASARAAGRLDPGRSLTGMFALSSIAMLAATPICWHHYFLWTMPACLFLIHRPWIVGGYAVVSLAGSASQAMRGVGWHMVLALGLFAMVAWEIHRSTWMTIEGRPHATHPRA
jgi:alpha-1,2-mannosyltransferase